MAFRLWVGNVKIKIIVLDRDGFSKAKSIEMLESGRYRNVRRTPEFRVGKRSEHFRVPALQFKQNRPLLRMRRMLEFPSHRRFEVTLNYLTVLFSRANDREIISCSEAQTKSGC